MLIFRLRHGHVVKSLHVKAYFRKADRLCLIVSRANKFSRDVAIDFAWSQKFGVDTAENERRKVHEKGITALSRLVTSWLVVKQGLRRWLERGCLESKIA